LQNLKANIVLHLGVFENNLFEKFKKLFLLDLQPYETELEIELSNLQSYVTE